MIVVSAQARFHGAKPYRSSPLVRALVATPLFRHPAFLILLAQTRQADRDRVHADADAQHREELARANVERQEIATRQTDKLRELLEVNPQLTQQVQQMAVSESTR